MQEYLIYIYAAVAFLGIVFGVLKLSQKSAFKKSPLSVTFWKMKNISNVVGIIFVISLVATAIIHALILYHVL